MNASYKIKVFLLSSGLFFLSAIASAPAQKPTAKEKHEQKKVVQSLLQGMQQQRSLLKSGEFKADAVVTDFATPLRIELKADCFFSQQFKKFRFDQDVKQITPHPKKKGEKRTLHSRSIYVKTPEYSIHTEGNNTGVRINDPDYKPYGYFSPFDIRVIGLINDSELLYGMSRSGSRWFLPGVLQMYQSYELERITRHSEGVYEVTWFFGKSNEFKLVLWIDELHGFTPTKYSVYRKTGTPKRFDSKPAIKSEITWKEIESVWVPVAFNTDSQFNHQRLEMKFEWLKINQPIPATVFTVDGMELPKGRRIEDNGAPGIIETSVIDHRGGTKKLIRGGTFIPDKKLE
ncbi:hypothetical protein Pan241w_27330 [Gimesia alba]|uniref:Outer membrane lipoprotein-sorting protein n=1 Tax=Gimesia alba TaxID=2527973 RepID=A0A517RFJ0_9PLAN|nr:outer membrane lipoprotein-sorting protein [Gimesia alba]QDT42646.1 hypothetical protein Pan241w_27330 [Gimesia alba]